METEKKSRKILNSVGPRRIFSPSLYTFSVFKSIFIFLNLIILSYKTDLERLNKLFKVLLFAQIKRAYKKNSTLSSISVKFNCLFGKKNIIGVLENLLIFLTLFIVIKGFSCNSALIIMIASG
ncbi:hypothetical protein JS55_00900 [Rickettsia felis str. LSU]|nr:hypothetical protein JS55_00900 [Rickettsia felis str. LSU]